MANSTRPWPRLYGWEPGLSEEKVLEKLVALNKERRAEEEQGLVRYLRPEYQAPEEAQAQAALELDVEVQTDGAPAKKIDWPKTLAERAQAVQQVVHGAEPVKRVVAHAKWWWSAPQNDIEPDALPSCHRNRASQDSDA